MIRGAERYTFARLKLFERHSMFPSSVLIKSVVSVPLILAPAMLLAQSHPVGIFTDHQDVGTVLHPGSAIYDAAHQTYTIAGSGDNMWFGADNFHYA
jgi:hypothetical protein